MLVIQDTWYNIIFLYSLCACPNHQCTFMILMYTHSWINLNALEFLLDVLRSNCVFQGPPGQRGPEGPSGKPGEDVSQLWNKKKHFVSLKTALV